MKHDDSTYIDGLNMATRVMTAARMLPMSKLTDEQIEAVRRDFTAYTKQQGLFYSQVAKAIGVSSSVVSQWHGNKYGGDVERITRLINRWLEQHARQVQATLDVEYVPTRVAEGLKTLAYLAHRRCSMGVAVMPSGTGKTLVLELLAQELTGFYLYCDEDMTPRLFLRELARSVGAKVTNSDTAVSLKAKIVKRPVFSRIRSIHDRARVPIIMAGTDEIIPSIDDSANGRGQLTSRTMQYNALAKYYNADDPDGSGGTPLFTRDEIRKLYANAQVKFDPEAVEFLWAMACLPGYGCLRTNRKLIELVLEKWTGEPVTRERLLTALPLHFGHKAPHIERMAQYHVREMRRGKRKAG